MVKTLYSYYNMWWNNNALIAYMVVNTDQLNWIIVDFLGK